MPKTWKQCKGLLMDEWIKKIWYTHKGILLSHKKNETLPFVTTQMDLEGITLSEINQTEKAKYCTISFIWGILEKKKKEAKLIETESRQVAWGWAWGN